MPAKKIFWIFQQVFNRTFVVVNQYFNSFYFTLTRTFLGLELNAKCQYWYFPAHLGHKHCWRSLIWDQLSLTFYFLHMLCVLVIDRKWSLLEPDSLDRYGMSHPWQKWLNEIADLWVWLLDVPHLRSFKQIWLLDALKHPLWFYLNVLHVFAVYLILI